MQRDDAVYLAHMLDMARKTVLRAQSRTRAQYDADEDLRMILAHLLQTIGEAASRASLGTRAAHPQIPWRQIIGIRHRIVHDYMHVDYDVLWEVVTRDLPPLIAALEKSLPPSGP